MLSLQRAGLRAWQHWVASRAATRLAGLTPGSPSAAAPPLLPQFPQEQQRWILSPSPPGTPPHNQSGSPPPHLPAWGALNPHLEHLHVMLEEMDRVLAPSPAQPHPQQAQPTAPPPPPLRPTSPSSQPLSPLSSQVEQMHKRIAALLQVPLPRAPLPPALHLVSHILPAPYPSDLPHPMASHNQQSRSPAPTRSQGEVSLGGSQGGLSQRGLSQGGCSQGGGLAAAVAAAIISPREAVYSDEGLEPFDLSLGDAMCSQDQSVFEPHIAPPSPPLQPPQPSSPQSSPQPPPIQPPPSQPSSSQPSSPQRSSPQLSPPLSSRPQVPLPSPPLSHFASDGGAAGPKQALLTLFEELLQAESPPSLPDLPTTIASPLAAVPPPQAGSAALAPVQGVRAPLRGQPLSAINVHITQLIRQVGLGGAGTRAGDTVTLYCSLELVQKKCGRYGNDGFI